MAKQPPELRRGHHVRPDAQDIFIDGYSGASVANAAVRLGLFRNVHTPNADGFSVDQEVFSYLVMSLPTAFEIHKTLGSLLESAQRDGLIQVTELASSAGEPEAS